MLDLKRLCKEFNINVKGIIQVGAHRGQELREFITLSPDRILLIEAMPYLVKHLIEICEPYKQVNVVNCAISNYNGNAKFHILSNDMSSSLLPLKRHSELYPHIVKVGETEVTCMRLDSLLKEKGEKSCNYNFLDIDVQGAEGLVFEGAADLLKHIDAIIVEVNYIELYEGCILEPELTGFLRKNGFEKQAEAEGDSSFPFPTWGDAFYVNKKRI